MDQQNKAEWYRSILTSIPEPASPQGAANSSTQPQTPKKTENILDEPKQTEILKEVILDNPTTDNDQDDVDLTDINQVNANAFVHEGGEMISLALNSAYSIPPDKADNDIARKILTVVDNNINIEQEGKQPNEFLVNKNGELHRSAGEKFSSDRADSTLDTDNSVYDMFENIKIDESTSKSTNEEIDKVLTEHTGVTSILATRDNTTSTNTAEKPNAPAQMGYIWGTGIVNWVRSNDPNDVDNVCYLCGHTMEQDNPNPGRTTDDWDYPEVEHKIPCTTAFTIFPSMDNLRWYYPYYTVKPGETSRASVEYRRTPVNDKSMLAWWLSFTPKSNSPGNFRTRGNAEAMKPFTGTSILSSDRFEYLRRLYISINKDRNTDINTLVYQNVKKLFRRFIQTKSQTKSKKGKPGFNETVFDYSWNVICLWLMEFAGSHKTCNQRKSQYNLMTIEGSRDAKKRKYNGGLYIGGSRKKSIDDDFNTYIDLKGNKLTIEGGIIYNHLTSIKEHYVTCCTLYGTVSAHKTLKRIHAGDKIEVYKRMHIWDNFRRIISYVTHIREEYFNNLSPSSSGRINKIEVAIGVVKEKIASIEEQYNVLAAKRKKIIDHYNSIRSSQRQLEKAQYKIDTELAALEEEFNDLNKELGDLVTKDTELNSQKTQLNTELQKSIDGEMVVDPDQPSTLSRQDSQESTSSSKRKAVSSPNRSADDKKKQKTDPPNYTKHTVSSTYRKQKGKKGKGGTRRKRRQLKSKHTRRVRKTKRKSKRTRRVRKPSRKSKTRRRVKK
jgi:hypothetical protein